MHHFAICVILLQCCVTQEPEFVDDWTNATSQAFCENYISNNPTTIECRKLVTLDEEGAIANCAGDILVVHKLVYIYESLTRLPI